MALSDRIRASLLAGLTAIDFFWPSPTGRDSIADQPQVSAGGVRPHRRSTWSKRTSPIPTNRTRWLQADVEWAARDAAGGNLALAASLYRTFQRDGTLQGLLGTRSGGLVRLPRRFEGDASAILRLNGGGGKPGLFDVVFPQSELEALDADGIVLGIGVGEFVQGVDDPLPTLVRLDPEFLRYVANEDRWYYRSQGEGEIPITPGDGRWVLHTPRGRYEPWNHGLWQALARAYVAKEHAFLYRENYAGKLANPARVAMSPSGAAEAQKQAFFRKVMAWGVNSVFGLTPGYEVKLLESNGRGYEVFADIIKTSDLEFMVAICGQVVTVTGGAGFANADIHATIRSDLIQGDGNALAATLSAQAIPPVVHDYVGPGARVSVTWDTRPPADLTAAAASLLATSQAIDALRATLGAYGLELDVAALLSRFAVPVKGDANANAIPDEQETGELPSASGAPQLAPPATPAAASAVEATTAEDEPSGVEALAAKMTEHGVARCEHGSSNRCRLCGVERVRDFEPGDDGAPMWRVAWRPIPAGGVA